MRESRIWLDRTLSVVTAIVVAATLYLLLTDRVLPALRGEPVRVIEGEVLGERFEFEPLADEAEAPSTALRVPGSGPSLLLVFSSTCPACYANLAAWELALVAARDRARVLAVGIERDRLAARAYARRHLPEALAVAPREVRRFAATLGIDVVPFTALVDGVGVLRYAKPGRLDSTAVSKLKRALLALTGSSNP